MNVPSNYDAENKAYTGNWTGEFALDKKWTNNPAWVFYDMIVSKRYGLAKYGSRYYVLGWAAHLPGYSSKPEGREFAELLLTLELMAKFPVVHETEWFQRSLKYLRTFETDLGTYIFPRGWLSEKKTSYWVGGTRMMFDERKGNRHALECESTFRVVHIKHLVNTYV